MRRHYVRHRCGALALLCCLQGLAGCDTGHGPAPASLPAPSWPEAAIATYHGLQDGGAVTLADGLWQGEPFVSGGASAPRAGLVQDFLLSGDLDGDGGLESVVLLWTSTGGSGTFDYLAVLDRSADGAVVNPATGPLGDRVNVRDAVIVDGRVVLDTVQSGPGDAACCPGQKVRRTWVLDGGVLTEQGAEDQGRLSLADLAGEWALTGFSLNEALGRGIQVTLTLDGENISGSSACNRYGGRVVAGDTPGRLSLAGPLISTPMACPEPLMEVEQRYLQALENVRGYSFLGGKLTLGWSAGEFAGTLFFERRPAASQAE